MTHGTSACDRYIAWTQQRRLPLVAARGQLRPPRYEPILGAGGGRPSRQCVSIRQATANAATAKRSQGKPKSRYVDTGLSR
jgi:hypothetical protein